MQRAYSKAYKELSYLSTTSKLELYVFLSSVLARIYNAAEDLEALQ
jgi:hypothetical protein